MNSIIKIHIKDLVSNIVYDMEVENSIKVSELKKLIEKLIGRQISSKLSVRHKRKRNLISLDNEDLYHVMKDWYAKQSVVSKKALLDGEVTGLMNCIESLEAYSDEEVAQAIAKAVTGVYLDTWRNELFDEFTDVLSNLKYKIENIKDDNENTRHELYFTGVDGKEIKSYYEPVTEGTGVILRNILEETLEDFDDLSENDRVGILLEMIEKIVRKK